MQQDDFDFDENDPKNQEFTGIHRYYPWKPYSYWRIEGILRNYFGWALTQINQGYKANRRPGYQGLYRVYEIETGKTVCDCASVYSMRKFLASFDFPEREPEVQRNEKAAAFLAAVERLREDTNELL